MSKVDRLRNRVEPFAALFWALDIVLANTWPCPPASLHRRTQSMSLHGHSFSIIFEDAWSPPPFYLGMLFIYDLCYAGRSSVWQDNGHVSN